MPVRAIIRIDGVRLTIDLLAATHPKLYALASPLADKLRARAPQPSPSPPIFHFPHRLSCWCALPQPNLTSTDTPVIGSTVLLTAGVRRLTRNPGFHLLSQELNIPSPHGYSLARGVFLRMGSSSHSSRPPAPPRSSHLASTGADPTSPHEQLVRVARYLAWTPRRRETSPVRNGIM